MRKATIDAGVTEKNNMRMQVENLREHGIASAHWRAVRLRACSACCKAKSSAHTHACGRLRLIASPVCNPDASCWSETSM